MKHVHVSIVGLIKPVLEQCDLSDMIKFSHGSPPLLERISFYWYLVLHGLRSNAIDSNC